MVEKIYWNTLLDTMTMMLSDYYAKSFHKWLDMLEAFKAAWQCRLRLEVANCSKVQSSVGKS